MSLCCDGFDFFFFKQKTAYEMRISDWSSDVCSSDLGLLKQTVLVETIGGLETVKTSGAAPILTRRWHAAIEEHSAISLKQRLVANIGITIAGSAQTISYAGVVIVGVGLIAEIGRASCRERVCQYV